MGWPRRRLFSQVWEDSYERAKGWQEIQKRKERRNCSLFVKCCKARMTIEGGGGE
jgi:hypothetical protein